MKTTLINPQQAYQVFAETWPKVKAFLMAGNRLTSLRDWLVHQQQELADALVYCTRAIEEIDKAIK